MCVCRAFIVDEVKLYAVPYSTESRQAELYLERKGVCHEKVDVSADEHALAEMFQLTGQTTRPVMVIGERVFVGFDQAELDQVMP
jgi:glutaredoxin